MVQPCNFLAIIHPFFFILIIHSALALSNETDRLALLEFKSKITHDPLGVLTSWNNSHHFCQWYGITCGNRHQRVTKLILTSLKLSGFISSHLCNLSFLKEIYLDNNSFIHEIPPQIGQLRRLRTLTLYNNLISGKIHPNISACSNLEIVYLDRNNLVGEIPIELTNMKKLKAISFEVNNLTGTLPSSLANLSSLELFSVARNSLQGVLPEYLGLLTNLWYLGLSQNQFSGTIPHSIFNHSLIEHIDLGVNHLQGNLPIDFGHNSPRLEFFSIAFNRFVGSVPISISNLSNLASFQITKNNLTGGIPSLNKLNKLYELLIAYNYLGSGKDDDLKFLSGLINATSLQKLTLDFNNFGGKLSEKIANFSEKLEWITFSNNQIHGKLPSYIHYLVDLNVFDGSFNKLAGTIPFDIGKMKNLNYLYLFNNNLEWHLPSSLGNLSNLIELYLLHNKFQGRIPSTLGNCKNLLLLVLSNKSLTGLIPRQIFEISSLSKGLYLSTNRLFGSVPNEIGNLKQLGSLALEENMFSGLIPSGLGGCESLEMLGLNNNNFQGFIPSSLSALRGLKTLDLSYNNLSGKIPTFFNGFRLIIWLNISYNNFDGMVPIEGIFKNASAIFLDGNKNLCGGISDFGLPECKSGKSKFTMKAKRIVYITSACIGAVLLPVCLFLWRSRKTKQVTMVNTLENGLLRLSYQNILKATNEFSSDNLIGSGSFGSVYKGILEEHGLVIAVKVLNLTRRGATKSFLAECEVLRNVRHRNLVKILTACSGIDYRGNDFKALVYEFMDNGNLHDWLHPNSELVETPRTLSILQRLNICIDVACALEYLHNHSGTPIVHCDLKPSNVLLDKEMTAHLSDFGLVKFLSNKSLQSPTNLSSSLGAIGTMGYCPPEYGQGSGASTAGDIFSFGILLLEIFTGKSPTDDMFKEELNISNYVESVLPEQVQEIIDPNLLRTVQVEEEMSSRNSYSRNTRNNRLIECLILLLENGISCSSESPQVRLNIADVVARLCSIRNKLVRTH